MASLAQALAALGRPVSSTDLLGANQNVASSAIPNISSYANGTPVSAGVAANPNVDLSGWGTFLDGGLVDPSQTAGDKGYNINQYLQQVQQYDPSASIQDVQGSDGQDLGEKINFDQNKLPQGWQQALGGTGGVELSDPSAHWSSQPLVNSNDKITDPTFGTYTSPTNIKQPVDNLDKYGMMATMAAIAAMTGGAVGPMLGSALGSSGLGTGLGNLAGSLATSPVTGANPFSDPTHLLLNLGLGATGIPGATTLGSLALGAARGNGVNPLAAVSPLYQLGGGLVSGLGGG